MLHFVRKYKIKYLFLIVILISLFVILFSAKFLISEKNRIGFMSAVSWLDTAITELLNEQFNKNGVYPDNLDKLNIPFPGDNANPDMLKFFTYVTDGNSFKLIFETNAEKKYRYEKIGVNGKMVKFNEYIGDKLIRSTDYNDLSIHEIKF